MNQAQINALNTVRAALPVFRDLDALYTAGIRTEQQLTAQRTIRAAKKDDQGIVLGAILCTAIVGVCFLCAMEISRFAKTGSAAAPISIILVLLGIAAGALAWRWINRKFKAKSREETPEDRVLFDRLDDISAKYAVVVQQSLALIGPIPADYRSFEALSFFEQALANGRAESMKEVMNLYEEHLHRMTLEQNSNLALQQQYIQTQMISAVKQSAHNASVNAGIAAGFSILSFLSRD